MTDNKHLNRLAIGIVIVAVVVVIFMMLFSKFLQETYGSQGITLSYEEELFNTAEIISVDILMDEEEWQELLKNAINEEYYPCDVVINGVTYQNVGIRAKGNTSLTQIYNDSTTDRYSFKIEFDHYVDGQTCAGLDKLVLNSNMSDATSMKEYLTYDMYAFLDLASSLYNYAEIFVNGQTWGLYLALEAVEESFAMRNYGTNYGEIYKPESMGIGGAGGMKDFDMDEINEMLEERWGGELPDEFQMPEDFQMPEEGSVPEDFQMPEGGSMPEDFQMPEGEAVPERPDMEEGTRPEGSNSSGRGGLGKGSMFEGGERPSGEIPGGGIPTGGMPGGGMSSGGSDLNYTDDNLDSYSTIWEGSVFKSSDKDHQRVVTALKNISEGRNLETYMYVDSVLKYLAVHTFVVNLDSLSSNMAHNYYLYEDDGALSIIPWDYNLAFGGFQSSDASSVINFPIDTPFSGVSMEDRQFFASLLAEEEYLDLYHSYLRQLVEEYVGGGRFEETYHKIGSQIDSLVADDPTGFYTESEYNLATQTLYKVVELRAESVLGQLEGTIPSTTDGQSADGSALIDASNIDLSVMGSMGMGRNNQDQMQRQRVDKEE